MTADIEKALIGYLASRAGARVVSRTPDLTTTPWVRVTLLDSPPTPAQPHVDWLVDAMCQFDCYAGTGGQGEANLTMRTVRAALVDAPNAQIPGVEVSSVRILGALRNPDSDFEPARERYALTASIVHHP